MGDGIFYFFFYIFERWFDFEFYNEDELWFLIRINDKFFFFGKEDKC